MAPWWWYAEVSDSLIQAMPDFVAFMRRDGVITHHLGGRQLQGMPNLAELVGRRLEEVWPESVSKVLRQMLKRALRTRVPVDGRYVDGSHTYEARVRPQGQDRVLCVIREIHDPAFAGTDERIERRGFLEQMNQSIATAVLRESPLSLCLIHLDGLAGIGQSMDFTIAEQIAASALRRLPASPASPGLRWDVGQLGEGLVAVAIHGAAERESVRATVQTLCDSLAAPVLLGDTQFYLAPCAGIAILGQDAQKPMGLLEHARAALTEARRAGPGALQFYSDTLKLLPQVRLDMERELRRAIALHQIDLSYVGRHDLASGRLLAAQAHLRWRHPLLGEVNPSEFLPMAASTGLAASVSRCALSCLLEDLTALDGHFGNTVQVSFAPLRHHLVAEDFVADMDRVIQESALSPSRFELRITERTLASLGKADRVIGQVASLGAALVIEEFGSGYSSLGRLAQLPLRALQMDRKWVANAAARPSALRFCRGTIALAHSYGLTPIAAGVNDEAARALLLELGCEQGLGGCFAPLEQFAQREPLSIPASG